MAKVTDQDIPSAVRVRYHRALQPAKLIRNVWHTIKRVHFRLPPKQGGKIKGTGWTDYKLRVTPKQKINRRLFGDCVRCFNIQPEEGGVEPPEEGPRNRSWWYAAAEASGLWYFDYFIQQTIAYFLAGFIPPWCERTGPLLYWTEENAPDAVNWADKYIHACESWYGNSKIIYVEKPEDMDELHVFIYAFSFGELYEVWSELIFSAHNTPLPEDGPTWNNYSRYGNVFKNYGQWARTFFLGHWITIDCPKCKVVQIQAHSDVFIEDAELTAYFVAGTWEDYPQNKPYWTTRRKQ